MHKVRLVSKGSGRQQPVGLCIADTAVHLFTEEGAVWLTKVPLPMRTARLALHPISPH